MIADILYNCNVFVDGAGYAGRTKEIKLPKVEPISQEYLAGGMSAKIDLPMGAVEKLEAEFTLAAFSAQVMGQVQVLPGVYPLLTARGSVLDGGGTQLPAIATMRASKFVSEPDAWKPTEESVLKCSATLIYYKLEVNGAVVHEVDPINMIFISGGGADQLAATRGNLGI